MLLILDECWRYFRQYFEWPRLACYESATNRLRTIGPIVDPIGVTFEAAEGGRAARPRSEQRRIWGAKRLGNTALNFVAAPRALVIETPPVLRGI